ncbi:MAG: hypothetical protein K0R54_1899 [Clostridiaceae bacterium]|jgi:hypothetical protein|nr:hypothetical protein [Clostridiaceae bacterium]
MYKSFLIWGDEMDNFYEQLVTTSKTIKYRTAGIAAIVLCIMGILAEIVGQLIPGLIIIALAALLYYNKKIFYVEYEYAFTNGDVDIDKILEKKNRSKIISFNIKDCELLAPRNSDYIRDFSNKPQKMLSLYPETYTGTIYTAMITGGANRLQLDFAPDNEFLGHCIKYNPRGVKIN